MKPYGSSTNTPAYRKGYHAGVTQRNTENPYPKGSLEYDEFLKAFAAGASAKFRRENNKRFV